MLLWLIKLLQSRNHIWKFIWKEKKAWNLCCDNCGWSCKIKNGKKKTTFCMEKNFFYNFCVCFLPMSGTWLLLWKGMNFFQTWELIFYKWYTSCVRFLEKKNFFSLSRHFLFYIMQTFFAILSTKRMTCKSFTQKTDATWLVHVEDIVSNLWVVEIKKLLRKMQQNGHISLKRIKRVWNFHKVVHGHY